MIRLSRYFIFLLLLSSIQGSAQDLFDLENSKAFAAHLYRSGQYDLASQEYERVVFIDPSDSLAMLRLIRSYRFSNELEIALNRNIELNNTSMFQLPSVFATEYSLGLIASGQKKSSFVYLMDNAFMDTSQRHTHLLGLHVLSAEWEYAREFIEMHPDVSTPQYLGLRSIVDEGSSLKYKSPGLALAMSAIVPGSGKMYAGQWGDGFIALAFVGTNVWSSYRGFSDEGIKSPYGWVFGALAFAFYAGDIYGSFKAVKRYNHHLDENLRDQAYHLLMGTP